MKLRFGFYRIESTALDWDAGNFSKVQKHGVGIEEIELLFQQEVLVAKDIKNSSAELRWWAVGTNSADRCIFISFTIREVENNSYIRVISARFTHQKERDVYERIKKEVIKNRK